MESVIEKTTKEEQQIAQSSLLKLQATSRKFVRKNSKAVSIKLHEKEDYIKIPKKAFYMLVDVLNLMAEGGSVAMLPADAQVSTQQAADLLNVSRPYLVALLEEGKIPFKKTGTHRRIQVKDILIYRKKMKEKQRKGLALLTKQAQELNLGYR